MRAHLRTRARGTSLSTVPPPTASADYSPALAKAAASILYRSPIRSGAGHVVYVLNAAALPDTYDVDYDSLLPYVLSRLPGEDDLVNGTEYEVVFFAGSGSDGATSSRKERPGWGWFFQAYHALTRAMRKRIRKLYVVHERTWVRVLVEMFSTIVSPKFRRKIVHASTLTALALHMPIEDLLIPPSAYVQDRRLSVDIHVPYSSGRRAFGNTHPLPRSFDGKSRLPRVLRETSSFLLMDRIIDTEGLFRIPPQVKMKEVLREAYDRGQKFIAWKENGVALPFPKYPNAESSKEILDEVDQTEAYGAHLAAGLMKFWYLELKEPIVPKTAYRELTKIFGSQGMEPGIEELTELLSTSSEWSPLPPNSREILTRHLIPLLVAISEHHEFNKMNADNLAVCFAPNLVCGPDQLEDIKMSKLIRQILTKAIGSWPKLRETCGISPTAFAEDLKAPSRMEDYEDPLDIELISKKSIESGFPIGPVDLDSQSSGIIMKDNEDQEIEVSNSLPTTNTDAPPLPPRSVTTLEQSSTQPPPLPPRASTQTVSLVSDMPPRLPPRGSSPEKASGTSGSSTDDANGASGPGVRRKPAPPLSVPPRYSTVIGNPNDVTESPSTYTTPADGFGPPRRGHWSIHETDVPSDSPVQGRPRSESQIRRKPVTPSSSKDEKS